MGEAIDLVLDVISVGCGVYNLVKNIKAGNTKAAWGDAAGIGADLFCAVVPGLSAGVGVTKTVTKTTVNVVDGAADAVSTTKVAENVGEATLSYSKNSPVASSTTTQKGGENSHTILGKEMHKKYNPGEGYIKEFPLPSGKRADAVNIDKADVRELKPNNKRAIKAGEKQVKNYVNELKELYPDKKWEWHIDTYDK